MRETAMFLTFVLALAGLAPPALADRGHLRPRITRAEFVRPPLKAGTLERLVVVAHDPDSWISEIQVRWEDAEGNGGIIFAHTYCVQDPDFEHPGTPARLRLDVGYEHPGPYHVEIRAISEKLCDPSNDRRISRTVEMDVEVVDPLQAWVEPEDAEGPLDVLELSQTIVADEAALGNHAVHTVTVSDDLGPIPLGGSTDRVDLGFDTDGDPATLERTIEIDHGPYGLLAPILDSDGVVVGQAAVSAEGATLTIDVEVGLLGMRVSRYGWFVLTHDASHAPCTATVPCIDRAPDAGTLEHVL